MKKYADILNEIKTNAERVKELDSFTKSAKWSERNAAEIVKAAAEAETIRIENKILHDNARRALVAEVLPIILEELNKYNGKPYGEKTREKINSAVKARANCAFYIDSRTYGGDRLNIVPLDKNGYSGTGIFRYNDFEILPVYENGEPLRVLIDNKINVLPAEKLFISNCPEYVENTREHAEAIRAEFNAIKIARDEYAEKISAFNKMIPSGLKEIPYVNYISNLM